MVHLVLYEPDQAGNVGTLLRLGACMNVKVHIIEPCGFPFSDKALKRSGMDYVDHVDIQTYIDWNDFREKNNTNRVILLTTKTTQSYTDFKFQKNDMLLLGSESAGVPEFVHEAVDEKVTIKMYGTMRSLNIAIAGAMVLGETVRQIS
jgi:tRNA (cytidine/uridine-2'-O-)-methyltransferase